MDDSSSEESSSELSSEEDFAPPPARLPSLPKRPEPRAGLGPGGSMEVVVTKLNRFKKRVVKCIVVTDEEIKTVDPETANVGNSFTFDDFVRASVDAVDHAAFNLVVKKGKRGTETLHYTCPSEADCLRLVAELNRSRAPELADSESGWMLKKHPRGTKYQRRFFVLQGSTLRYYNSDTDLSHKKHPVSLDALRTVRDPTEMKGMGPEAFDLVFIDKTYTLTEEDTAQSRRFGALLRALEPPSGAVSLKDSSGVKLLVLECLQCGTLNAVKQKVIEVSKKKGKMLPCSKCHTKLDPNDAQEQVFLFSDYYIYDWFIHIIYANIFNFVVYHRIISTRSRCAQCSARGAARGFSTPRGRRRSSATTATRTSSSQMSPRISPSRTDVSPRPSLSSRLSSQTSSAVFASLKRCVPMKN